MKSLLYKIMKINLPVLLTVLLLAVTASVSAQDLHSNAEFKILGLNEIEQELNRTGSVDIIVRFEVFDRKMADYPREQRQIFQSEISSLQDQVLSQLSSNQVEGLKRFRSVPGMAFRTTEAGINTLLRSGTVKHIQYDQLSKPHLSHSNDIINSPQVWSMGYTGAGKTVVVLDSGIEEGFEMFDGKIAGQACFSASTTLTFKDGICANGEDIQIGGNAATGCENNPDCTPFHGSHVAGIVAGERDTHPSNRNGVAPGANLIPIQVFHLQTTDIGCGDSDAPCLLSSASDQILALEHVYLDLLDDHEISAVNMSLGGGEYDSPCDSDARKDIIDNLRSENVATIISSGNDGFDDAMGQPACISSAISVGSTQTGRTVNLADGSVFNGVIDKISSFSNSNQYLDLLAPGQRISSANGQGGYNTAQGTSMAAPQVAGAWALMQDANPGESVDVTLNRLKRNGVLLTDSRNGVTTPRIDVYEAVKNLYTSGTITENTTWGNATETVYVEGTVTIASGAELTIEEGVEVRFDSGTRLAVNGTLIADGVTFTANSDTPTAEFWRGIAVTGGDATILNSSILYSGSSSSAALDVSSTGNLIAENITITNGFRGIATSSGTASITTVEISEMSNNAIRIDGGMTTVSEAGIQNVNQGSNSSVVQVNAGEINLVNSSMENGYRGLTVVNGVADFNTVTIQSMTNHGVYIESNAEIEMTESSISETIWPVVFNGPGSLILDGVTTVEDNVNQAFYIGHTSLDRDFTIPTAPVPYYFPNHYTVSTDYTFTVDPHNILKIDNNRRITVNGSLIADATPDSIIYFTSYADDNLGGDTNNDGSASSPGATSWNGIDINSSSGITSLFRNTRISYAGTTSSSSRRGAMNLFSASPTVENSTFMNNRYGLVLYGSSTPELTENTIGISTVVPIAMVLSANPQFTNNTFSFQANEYDAIGLIDGSMPVNAYLPKRDVTDIENVTYLMLENLTVPNDVTLEIEEGVVIKSVQNRRLRIEGKLIAQGTESEKIVFTSWKDDNFGNPNDTNKDGNQTVPGVGDWYGIHFTEDADDESIIDHAIIQFARSNNVSFAGQSYRNGAIMVTSVSPTFTNTEIRNVEIGIGLIGNSNSVITDNSFINTSSVPLALSMAADPTLENNSLTNAEIIALGLFGEDLGLNGAVTKKNFGGHENITYFILDDITIKSSAEVTVDPGIVFKASSNTAIFVDGGFQINGTADERVVFTSFRDDNFGNPGDTNNDGNATSPSDNDWGTVMYRGTSNDSFNTVQYADFRFGRVGMAFQNSSPTVEHTLLNEASYFGITADGAAEPVFNNVTIRNMNLDPILLSVKSNPSFSNITFDANGSNGIRILEGYSSSFQLHSYITNTTTIGSDATIFQRDIAGINNIAYVITTRMNVSSSAKLTINPGVVMKFQSSGSIRVDGALEAEGGTDQLARIVFTDYRDDSSGGDTNNDGNATSPSRGSWNGIEFYSSGMESENIIKNADIRYATNTFGGNSASIMLNSAYAMLDNVIIEQSSRSAVAFYGSSDAVLQNSAILNVSQTPIRLNMFANPTFNNNDALNIGSMAIGVVQETYSVDATVPLRDFAGYENITYELHGNLTVNSGTEITIPAGTVFKRSSINNQIIVEGTLKVLGTDSNPVVLTHLSDDSYGNPADTQNDGSASSPGIINRPWIIFESSSNDAESIIEHSIIKYARHGIELNSAAPTVTNNMFENLTWGLQLGGVSEPVLTNNTFRNLELAPMEISLVSYPEVTSDNVIEGSTYRAIGIVGETLVQDVSLPARTFAGIERIPYYLENNYTIGTGAVLTIEPGVIMKFNRSQIDVKKGLIAQGGDSPEELIVFTDYRDDFYGGDTNADSSATSPPTSNFQSWDGIKFESESLAPFSILDHVVIKHVYHNTRGAVTAENASPTITNSILAKNRYGVYATGNANPVIHYNDIYDNTNYGVYNRDESFEIDATMNWWGDDTGPTHSGNSGGLGDEVSNAVNYDPWEGSGAMQLALGDVSLNGSVGAFDASLVLRHTVGDIVLNQPQLRNAEVSGDGTVSAFDASLILQYVVNIISFFPAEAAQKAPDQEPLVEYNVSDIITMIENVDTEPGKTITVPVVIDNVEDLLAIEADLQFDNELLTLQSIEKTGLSEDMQLIHRYDEENQLLRISAAGIQPVNESGTFLNIIFAVSDAEIEQADAYVRFERILANEKDVTPYSEDGVVNIETLPERFSLSQNYPNPFNPTTNINFELPQNEQVRLTVYDMIGRSVAILVDQRMEAGSHTVSFDASNLASGVYIYRIEAGEFTATNKMLLVK